jgi:molybdate transport system substrate-binding protein
MLFKFGDPSGSEVHGMFRNSIVAFVLIIGAIFAAAVFGLCGTDHNEILVSAAISLKGAFEEIGAAYEKQTGIKVQFNFGASGLLQKQIETGAPVDVFASAGEKQMDDLQSKGIILAGTRCNFARNTLVLVVPQKSGIRIHSFEELTRPEVTRIAIGNPKTVPAGQYAQEALTNLKLWDKLQSRLVLAENVRQVLDYVARMETDAGIVYASDLSAAHGTAKIAAYAPNTSHSPILYPIALVKDTKAKIQGQRFIDLVLSDEGQKVLTRNGFLSAR